MKLKEGFLDFQGLGKCGHDSDSDSCRCCPLSLISRLTTLEEEEEEEEMKDRGDTLPSVCFGLVFEIPLPTIALRVCLLSFRLLC